MAQKPSLASFIKSPIQPEDMEEEREMNAQSMWESLRGPRGRPGKDGKTPKRGEDYWTEEDKKEIVTEAVELIPRPKDGKTPKKGKDYFTDSEKQEFASMVRDSVVELIPDVQEETAQVKLTAQDIEGLEELVKSYVPEPEIDEFTDLFIKELKKQSGASLVKDSAGLSLLIQKLGENFYKGYVAGPGFGGSGGGGTASPLTTKGDLYTYSTANARLPVGSNGQVLSADSSQATGLKWIAAGGTTFYSETPSGAVNGSNTSYTVANTISTIITFAINGQFIHPSEYSVVGATITFNTALPASLSGTSFTIVYV